MTDKEKCPRCKGPAEKVKKTYPDASNYGRSDCFRSLHPEKMAAAQAMIRVLNKKSHERRERIADLEAKLKAEHEARVKAEREAEEWRPGRDDQ